MEWAVGDRGAVLKLADLRQLIQQAQRNAATTVNVSLTMLYWHIGKRIHREVLGQQRADYGERIVATLSRQSAAEYGRGFEEKRCTAPPPAGGDGIRSGAIQSRTENMTHAPHVAGLSLKPFKFSFNSAPIGISRLIPFGGIADWNHLT